MSSSLFEELKRRNVYKVGVAYLVLAWVVVQVTSVAVPALHLPPWINSAVFLFGALGFPFALFFAWEFELTPDGVKRESEISPEDSVTAHTGRKLDFIIIGLLAAALSYFIYESRFASSPSKALVAENEPASEAPLDLSNKPEGSSIAVLPFVNMSSDPEQEYFSDGISEEILNVLAQIPKLHVTSRSSAFSFKGKEIIVSDVAKQLGVKHVLEGSVRKVNNRVRITAQLIEADTDKHLWSESYDRELTDIFAIQDEISAAIVTALKAKLGLAVKVVRRDMSAVSPAAHNEYLQGRFYLEKRTQAALEKALSHFDKAVEIAPEYALAWVGKAWTNNFLSETAYGNLPRAVSEARARPAIEKALQLAPNLPEAHAIMGLIESINFGTDKAIIHYQKAIELNPNYAEAIAWYGMELYDQPKKRFALYQKAVQLSPMSLMINSNYAFALIEFGRIAETRDVVEHMLSINPLSHLSYGKLGIILLIEGKYAEAIIAFATEIKFAPKDVEARFNAAISLSTIGLGNDAANYINGTVADPVKYMLKGDLELYINQVRATFPRSENDSLGLWARGRAEVFAENYVEARKFFKLTSIQEFSNDRIYSDLQTGNIEEAQALIEKAWLQVQSRLDADAKYFTSANMYQPIAIRVMEIACLKGNVEEAIIHLKKAMKQNYIVNYEYLVNPIFKQLRAHADWPAIIAQSDKRAAIQRELYLKLSADNN